MTARKALRHQLEPPPPVLGSARVLWWARSDDASISYRKDPDLLVSGRPLGRAARIVIGEDLLLRENVVLFCTRSWLVRGCVACPTAAKARARAESHYAGIEKLWQRRHGTRREAQRYFDEVVWKGQRCAFCGRRPYQLDSSLTRRKTIICRKCARECADLVVPIGESKSSATPSGTGWIAEEAISAVTATGARRPIVMRFAAPRLDRPDEWVCQAIIDGLHDRLPPARATRRSRRCALPSSWFVPCCSGSSRTVAPCGTCRRTRSSGSRRISESEDERP